MHELLLFALVPPQRHTLILSILAGIASMQPIPIYETHHIFKPLRSARSLTGNSGVGGGGGGNAQLQALQAQTQGELFYLKVVGEGEGGTNLSQRDNNNNNNENDASPPPPNQPPIPPPPPSTSPSQTTQTWTLQFRDLPEVASRRPVTSRLMTDVQFTTNDPLQFMAAMEYTHTSSYTLTGHRLTHLSTSFLLSRASVPSSASSSSPNNPPTTSTDYPANTTHPVDPSGTYILSAAVRVQDGSKPELMTRGISELLKIKDMLKGVVDLGVGDRLSLDTRIR